MHYYQFNIPDFNNATRHLSRLERSIYRDMLDFYYDTEKPLVPADGLARKLLLHTEEEVQAMEICLHDFFVHEADGYHHLRCDKEIAHVNRRSHAARESAKKRWECERNAKGMRTHSERIANPMLPNTQHLTPNTQQKKGRFTPPTVEEVENYCRQRQNTINPEAFIAHYEANGWMRGKNKIKSWQACIRTWETKRKDDPSSQNIIKKVTDRSWAQ